MLGGPLKRSGFPPPSGSVTPPRCGLFLRRRSHERLTGALLDRLTHHVHILELNGESYRLAHSKKARHPAAAPAS